MAGRLYFITGGARSGKSSFAEGLAEGLKGRRAYLATAQAVDAEMVSRIEQHRSRRGAEWDTYEEPLALAELLPKLGAKYDVVLIDCLTLWLSNVMEHSDGDEEVRRKMDELLHALRGFGGACIVVSNEVGLGIVPENPVARRFRDLAGVMNQKVAKIADEAYLIASGIPMRLK